MALDEKIKISLTETIARLQGVIHLIETAQYVYAERRTRGAMDKLIKILQELEAPTQSDKVKNVITEQFKE